MDLPENSYFEVHFIDVGQGDAALVICDGEAMLIDGGSSDQSALIYTYLKSREINHLKYIIASHNDEDHVGGLSGALNWAEAENAICSSVEYAGSRAFENFLKYLGDTKITVAQAGTVLELGCARGTVLGPVTMAEDSNNNSLVIRMEYGATSFLFTGDAEEEEERSILESGAYLKSTVLKTAHHGSSTSTSEEFLQAVTPSFAIISCGAANDYHHPTDRILNRFKDRGVQLFRTDMQGTIICKSDGRSVTFQVEKNPDADTFATYDELYPNRQMPSGESAYGAYDDTERTYVINTNSNLIHLPSCSDAAKISERNRFEVYGTLEDILQEYPDVRPCRNCIGSYYY